MISFTSFSVVDDALRNRYVEVFVEFVQLVRPSKQLENNIAVFHFDRPKFASMRRIGNNFVGIMISKAVRLQTRSGALFFNLLVQAPQCCSQTLGSTTDRNSHIVTFLRCTVHLT